ncbi:MAG TPA: hypothetical protein PKH94_08975 [Bacteroidales bacterium]|nr:hypothetical protein [Bacteroidales bacterium]HNS47357.1 hypothetical protein [Bacteroidales bacterium]
MYNDKLWKSRLIIYAIYELTPQQTSYRNKKCDKFSHPDDEGIARIINNKSESREINLYFNYESEINHLWSDSQMRQDYGYDVNYPDNDTMVIDMLCKNKSGNT